MLKNLRKKKKGFTLIELIIVIAIIAVLAAIAVPKFGEVRRNANAKSDIANAKNIQSAAVALLGENSIAYSSNNSPVKYTLDSAVVEPNADAIEGYLQSIPTTKLVKNGKYIVSVDNKGSVIVYIVEGTSTKTNANNQVYPQPSNTSGNNWYSE